MEAEPDDLQDTSALSGGSIVEVPEESAGRITAMDAQTDQEESTQVVVQPSVSNTMKREREPWHLVLDQLTRMTTILQHMQQSQMDQRRVGIHDTSGENHTPPRQAVAYSAEPKAHTSLRDQALVCVRGETADQGEEREDGAGQGLSRREQATSGRRSSSPELNDCVALPLLHSGSAIDQEEGPHSGVRAPETKKKGAKEGTNDKETKRQEDKRSSVQPERPGNMNDILHSIKFAHLPPPTFRKGTCSEYWHFKRLFNQYVDPADLSDEIKLTMLLSAYTGPMKTALQGCLDAATAKEGYALAFSLLDQEHGDRRTYKRELVNNVLYGPTVTATDIKALEDFIHNLTTGISNLKRMGALSEINTQQAVCLAADRLKGRLLEEYNKRVYRYEKEHEDESPDIEWLLAFLREVLERTKRFAASGTHSRPDVAHSRSRRHSSPTPFQRRPSESGIRGKSERETKDKRTVTMLTREENPYKWATGEAPSRSSDEQTHT